MFKAFMAHHKKQVIAQDALFVVSAIIKEDIVSANGWLFSDQLA